MAIIRAVAVLKHVSGLARDNCVNTFHFTGELAGFSDLNVVDAVRRMYLQPLGEPGNLISPLGTYLSPAINTLDVHLYEVPGTLTDGKETPAGPPRFSSLGNPGDIASLVGVSATPLPSEVAACISYQGTPGAGVVQRRRRGRIYIGPLNTGASAKVGSVARPSAPFRDAMRDAMLRMINEVDDGAEFVVYSRPFAGRAQIDRPGRAPLPAIPARPATTVNVDQIWVDDEFDTQRRRGLQRTTRTLVSTGEA